MGSLRARVEQLLRADRRAYRSLASGEVVDRPIPHVNLMGGSAAWRHDGSGFWYTLCADPAGFRQQVWCHETGGAQDRLDVPEGFVDEVIAENFLSASPDGRWVMDRVQRGDGGEWQVFVRSQDPGSAWWQLADVPDRCSYAVLGADAVYLLSRRDAPHGKVLRVRLTEGATVANCDEVVPVSDLVVEDVAVTRGRLWVVDMDGGPQQLLGPDRVGWSQESFTEPPTWWVAADEEPPQPTALSTLSPVDLSGYEVIREFATSRDGTRVPLNVLAAPGAPARRVRAGAADGVRRLRDLAGATVRPRGADLARAGRRPGRREHPAPPVGSGWRSWAAPTAGC